MSFHVYTFQVLDGVMNLCKVKKSGFVLSYHAQTVVEASTPIVPTMILYSENQCRHISCFKCEQFNNALWNEEIAMNTLSCSHELNSTTLLISLSSY